MIHQACIVAAGEGSRFGNITDNTPKPLLRLCGLSLLERVIYTCRKTGIRDFVIVTGFLGNRIREEIESCKPSDIRIQWAENEEWKKKNGVSVLKAAPLLEDRFLLLMSDHIFSAEMLEDVLKKDDGRSFSLAVDPQLDRIFDTEDVTKVSCEEDKILDIGKELTSYNGADTGIFIAGGNFLTALELIYAENGDCSITEGCRVLIDQNKFRAITIETGFWQDVDTPACMKEAQHRLLNSLRKDTDGYIAARINRRISLFLTSFLCRLPIHPNLMTVCNFFIGAAGALLLAVPGYLNGICGALLFQASSIFDGCDGETARLKFTESRLGGWLDLILDNVVHLMIFAAIGRRVYLTAGKTEALILGTLMMVGVILSIILVSRAGVQDGKLGTLRTGEADSLALKIVNYLARRDFTYLLLALSLLGSTGFRIFAWLTGVGANIFAFTVFLLFRGSGAEAQVDPAEER